MRSYSYTYLTLKDVCKHNELDYGIVMDAICNSSISFGTNFDTLITSEHLDIILYNAEIIHSDLDYDGHDVDKTVVISLGS